MSFLSEKLNRVKPSPTLAVTAKAAELRAAGHDVIGLGAGEPDFDTPDYIKEAAKQAIDRGDTKYTKVDGTPALKDAIIEKFSRDNGLNFTPDEITVNSGGKHTIYNALMATLNPGDEVIIPAPYWVSYPDMTKLAGGEPVIIKAGVDAGYKITPEQLDAAITDNTKWLIFNSPSNPTGAAYSEAEIAALGSVIRRHEHVYVLADDIYEHIVYDDFAFKSFAQVNPDLKSRTLTMNGMAKAYAMTGWRIGFAGGPAPLIKAMAKVQSQSTSNPCSISQAASAAALLADQSFLAERAAVFQERRDLVVSALDAIDGITCPTPEGAFYVYPDISGVIGRKTAVGKTINSDLEFVSYLLEDYQVAAVHGEAFGLSPAFRVSYATATELLEEACRRIKTAVDKLD